MSEKLPGYVGPGEPIDRAELKKAWMPVYAALMILMSRNEAKRPTVEKMQEKLAEANELVMQVLENGS